MRNVRKMMIVITCMALLGAMQAMAVTYSPQKPMKQTYGQPMHVVSVSAPSVTFHSTSSLQSSGSVYTSTPTLNENGTVNEEAYGVGQSGPRRSKMDGGMGTPDDGPQYHDEENPEQNNPNGFPIGDAVSPLMLMAGAFALFVYFRRKQTLNG